MTETQGMGEDSSKDKPIRGRGAQSNPVNRFAEIRREMDPSANYEESDFDPPQTRYYIDHSQSLITYNDSPDLGFSASLNAYRGCTHGCSYCYARPFHEYLGWSAGLDFESRIMVKTQAPVILRKELASKGWKPQTVSMSGVTDCYQPAEREFQLTRQCLEVFLDFRNPVAIVTKNALVTRDMDILKSLASYECVKVYVSITSLDMELSGKLEPRASRPTARLEALQQLSQAGIPVGVLVAPVIPGLNESEIPAILKAAGEAGAASANYILLRLPHGVKDIFGEWLEKHFPLKKEKVLADIRSTRDGELYDADFKQRMSGTGVRARQIMQLFQVARDRAGYPDCFPPLSTHYFRRRSADGQMDLFSSGL